jgi:hypothetical protein
MLHAKARILTLFGSGIIPANSLRERILKNAPRKLLILQP